MRITNIREVEVCADAKSFLVPQGQRELQGLSAVGQCVTQVDALQRIVTFALAFGLWLVP